MLDLGSKFVLQYLQKWDYTLDEKVEVLNEAIKAAGIDAVFVVDGNSTNIVGTEQDVELAKRLEKELSTNWHLGKFEREAERVDAIIKRYKERR